MRVSKVCLDVDPVVGGMIFAVEIGAEDSEIRWFEGAGKGEVDGGARVGGAGIRRDVLQALQV